MGMNSCGEELIVKTRKPYTIRKQRERWTEEEHNRFLEALKLYGRAWQRIEEHIGTKTAVQIRSHAQKFFTKLEKESLTKGVPLGHAHDIEIPPPRPKRKPSTPYPQKTSSGVCNSSLGAKDGKPVASDSSVYPSKQVLDLENEQTFEKTAGTEILETKKTTSEGTCSEVNHLLDAHVLITLAHKSSASTPKVLSRPCTFREFVPLVKDANVPSSTDGSSLTAESKLNQKLCKADTGITDLDTSRSKGLNMENCALPTCDKVVSGEGANNVKQEEKLPTSSLEAHATLNYPRNVPVHVVDGSIEKCKHTPSSDMTNSVSVSHQSGAHGNPNPFSVPSISPTGEHYADSGRSSAHPSFPILQPPCTLFRNDQDSYQSFLNISHTFSSLILSTLLQNPAVHAAACVAASFWPCIDDSSADTLTGGYSAIHAGQSPNLGAIVAATVAAASAWWASHGLLPFCPPPPNGFSFHPAATTIIPPTGTTQAPEDNKEKTDCVPQAPAWEDHRVLDPESSTAMKSRSPATKSTPLSSCDSEESGGRRSHDAEKKASSHEQRTEPCSGIPDSDKGKTRKPLDRSSCGSNTTSGSEVETDILEKQVIGKEESKESKLNHPAGEAVNRRCRNIGNNTDSWKEVSEEGRMAFHALFSREVLPQSFSPPHDLRSKADLKNSHDEENQKLNKIDEDAAASDVGNKTFATSLDNLQSVEMHEPSRTENPEKAMLTNILFGYGKMKGRRTGFKPYKRCSMEAKESRIVNSSSPSNEKGAKRIRLEGEASI